MEFLALLSLLITATHFFFLGISGRGRFKNFFLDKKVYNKSAWLEWEKFFDTGAIYWITTMKKAFMKFLISLQNFPLLQLVRGNVRRGGNE